MPSEAQSPLKYRDSCLIQTGCLKYTLRGSSGKSGIIREAGRHLMGGRSGGCFWNTDSLKSLVSRYKFVSSRCGYWCMSLLFWVKSETELEKVVLKLAKDIYKRTKVAQDCMFWYL